MSLELSSSPKETHDTTEDTAHGTTNPENGEEVPASAPSGKKKIYIIIAILIIAIALAAGLFIFLKKYKTQDDSAAQEAQKEASKQQIFHDMDEIIINLNTEGKSVSFLKLTITLDVRGKENLDIVIKFMPRIRDIFQIYLRELRPTDMQGSVGLYRLREELLLRVNKLIYPAQVNDILFKEVLVQ